MTLKQFVRVAADFRLADASLENSNTFKEDSSNERDSRCAGDKRAAERTNQMDESSSGGQLSRACVQEEHNGKIDSRQELLSDRQLDRRSNCLTRRHWHEFSSQIRRIGEIDLRERKSTVAMGKIVISLLLILSCTFDLKLLSDDELKLPFTFADASLIIGDSAIEIQEVDPSNNQQSSQNEERISSRIILGSSSNAANQPAVDLANPLVADEQRNNKYRPNTNMPGPLPPLGAGNSNDNSANNRDDKSDNQATNAYDKTIAGKVVDFELTPAGGHNKAKIKKKKQKKKKAEEEMFKKWGKKKKEEKKAMEKKHKQSMKKKQEEGKKKKKKWGHEEHGLKKKGKFKKKKWGKKVKKGKGIKKGKKGKKFLKDKGHKNTGFKTVYHKEEWGKSSKWHDIKREKKWDEKSKKWKKKWKKEKGKKYKGDHMKKFEKKKKEGKKYKKEKKDKYKKFKKEKFEKGKKKKMEEHGKKKEEGKKKEMKEMKKKKKKP